MTVFRMILGSLLHYLERNDEQDNMEEWVNAKTRKD